MMRMMMRAPMIEEEEKKEEKKEKEEKEEREDVGLQLRPLPRFLLVL